MCWPVGYRGLDALIIKKPRGRRRKKESGRQEDSLAPLPMEYLIPVLVNLIGLSGVGLINSWLTNFLTLQLWRWVWQLKILWRKAMPPTGFALYHKRRCKII